MKLLEIIDLELCYNFLLFKTDRRRIDMIYLLLISLFILMILAFISNRNDVIAPAFLFAISFFGASVFASIYANRWSLKLHLNTFLVIFLGVLEFLLVSQCVKKVFKAQHDSFCSWTPKYIYIENIKLIFFLLFEIITIFYSIHTVVRLVNGSMSEFSSAIVKYRNMNMFWGERIALPRMINYSRIIVNAGGYWFSYVLVNNYFVQKRLNFKMVLIVLLSAISSYVLGGRNGLINIFVGLVCSYFIISNKSKNFRESVRFSTLIKLACIFVIVLSSFETLAFLIGRSGFEGASGLDYLAIYIGAPIKNLDTYLQEFIPNSGIGNQTFINLINWIGPKLGISGVGYYLDLPFRSIGSMTLGNVYTTFYAFIYDYGYIGVAILVMIMAIISQIIYEIVKRTKSTSLVPMSSLLYSYTASLLLMSFFSNKFFEQIFNISIVQMIVAWEVIYILFYKITIGSKKQNVNILSE